jgi:hypothetical protein
MNVVGGRLEIASGQVSHILKGTEAESVWKITDRVAEAIREGYSC